MKLKNFCFLLLIVPFFTISCELDENPDEGKMHVKYITNDIDTTVAWYNKVVYVIKKQDLKINKTLIIEAGTVIKFDPSLKTTVTITDSGYISCQGTPSRPVVFTSLYDKNYGTLAVKSSDPEPKVGDWNSIYIKSIIPSSFNYTVFSYGGGGENKSTLIIDSVNADILNCTFAYNRGGNVDEGIGALNGSRALSKLRIETCVFYNNELPLSINSNISLMKGNTFKNLKDTTQTNKYNAIVVNAEYPIQKNITWEENQLPYIILGKEFVIEEGMSLMLNNNVVLKFIEKCKLIVPDGVQSILNQTGIEVVLTSINDDRYKGDTRNDKDAILPAENDWSIRIIANKDEFEWDKVFYAKHEE